MRLIADNTFAAACYEQNTADELEAALFAPADKTDMAQWGLTEQDYYAHIDSALSVKRFEAEQARQVMESGL